MTPGSSKTPRRRSAIVAGLVAMIAIGCAPVYTSSVPAEGIARSGPPDRSTAEPRTSERPPAPRSVDRGAKTTLAGVLGALVWPLPVARASSLSSPYGFRIHPVRGGNRFHAGIDIRSSDGTPIYAAADGTVTSSGSGGAYGLRVVVDHGAGVSTLYAHASRILVEAGDPVERGEPIALVGATGNATGPHLHFELRWDGGTIDPRRALPRLAGTSPIYAAK